MAKEILKPCPWCGTIPEVEPWEGEKPTTHMVSCASEECKAGPSVIGGTRAAAIRYWNERRGDEDQ